MIAYSLLQLSYGITSHNFGLSLIGYGFVKASLVFLLLLAFVNTINLNTLHKSKSILETLLLKTYVKYTKSYRFSSLNQNTLSKIILLLLVIYLYILSFNPLLNNIF